MERIEHCLFGNGQPGLEDKLKKYVDERDNHKERNLQQEILDLRTDTNERHEENKKDRVKDSEKLDSLVKFKDEFAGAISFAKIAGAVIAFVCMATLALLGYLAANRPHGAGVTQAHPIVSSSKADEPAAAENQ